MKDKVLLKKLVDTGTRLRTIMLSSVRVSDEGAHPIAELWDANTTIDTIVGGASDSQNTLKKIEDKLNSEISRAIHKDNELKRAIDEIYSFTYFAAEELPQPTKDTMYQIYLIPSEKQEEDNIKDEYITIASEIDGETVYSWECVGSTAMDLSGYVKFNDLDDYYTKTEVNDIIGDIETLLSNI